MPEASGEDAQQQPPGAAGAGTDPADAQVDPVAHLVLPGTPLADRIERFVTRTGDALSWVWLVLVAAIVLNVGLRYIFGSGRIEFEEIQWHLYSIGFLGALAYCVPSDSHVRVDVLRGQLRPRIQAWIELYGILLLVMPFSGLVVLYGIPFVIESFEASEISPSPGGLPARWLIKAALPAGMVLLMLAYLARLLRVVRFLFVGPDTSGTSAGE